MIKRQSCPNQKSNLSYWWGNVEKPMSLVKIRWYVVILTQIKGQVWKRARKAAEKVPRGKNKIFVSLLQIMKISRFILFSWISTFHDYLIILSLCFKSWKDLYFFFVGFVSFLLRWTSITTLSWAPVRPFMKFSGTNSCIFVTSQHHSCLFHH